MRSESKGNLFPNTTTHGRFYNVKTINMAKEYNPKVCNGDYDHFITSKANGICHVRPHGTKGQTVSTSQGNRVQPKCFWLNNDYILNIVLNELN